MKIYHQVIRRCILWGHEFKACRIGIPCFVYFLNVFATEDKCGICSQACSSPQPLLMLELGWWPAQAASSELQFLTSKWELFGSGLFASYGQGLYSWWIAPRHGCKGEIQSLLPFAPFIKPHPMVWSCTQPEARVPFSLHKDEISCQFLHLPACPEKGPFPNSQQNSVGRQTLARVYSFSHQDEKHPLVLGHQIPTQLLFAGTFLMKIQIWERRWKCLPWF